MRKAFTILAIILLPACLPLALDGSTTAPAQRWLVSVGANRGSADRTPLRYAVTDAENFAKLLEGMGGVDSTNCVLLRDPSMREFVNSLESLRAALASTRTQSAGRAEVVFYYSGHADENGILLGDERFSYQSLRQWLNDLHSDLEIAILDACASGAITRLKGGQHQQAFLIDSSVEAKGYAFLTSSSENEAAQESDRLKGSFFTHYLVSGLRGAADSTGDGKVTLNEAYQFAYNETLVRTAKTQGGTQHPAYDMKLVGTGDVVITDVRKTSAGLVLAEDLYGRLFIRNSLQQLVVELQKAAGREIQLGLEPGDYTIDLQQKDALWTGVITLAENERLLLTMGAFRPANREATQRRGAPREEVEPEAQESILLRAHSVGFGFGFPVDEGFSTDVDRRDNDDTTHTKLKNVSFYVSYENRLQPEIALTFTTFIHVVDADIVTEDDDHDDTLSSEINTVMPAFFGAKFFPVPPTLKTTFQPYLTAGFGPVFVIHSKENNPNGDRWDETDVTTEFGGMVGAGLDLRFSRVVFLNVNAGYQVSTDFRNPIGGKKNLNDTYFFAGIGFQFGKTLLTRE
ncbi:MAG: caspase family protein [Acidobacteriota bacterium]